MVTFETTACTMPPLWLSAPSLLLRGTTIHETEDLVVANAEKLRAFWEAWTPGGEMDMSILDPDVIYEDSNLPDHIGEAYRGHEGIARATGRWLESYESLTIELERIVGSGDRLVSIHRGRSKARYTGIEEEGPLAYLWTFRDGKVIHFRSYRKPAEALEAAGLRG
jgi:ketosteroid isomerase-like protein